MKCLVAAIGSFARSCRIGAGRAGWVCRLVQRQRGELHLDRQERLFHSRAGLSACVRGHRRRQAREADHHGAGKTKKIDGVETRDHRRARKRGRQSSPKSRATTTPSIRRTTTSTTSVKKSTSTRTAKLSITKARGCRGKTAHDYGLFMPAKPEVGQKYYQEIAPEKAMDRFEVKSLSEQMKVPAGEFTGLSEDGRDIAARTQSDRGEVLRAGRRVDHRR